MTDLHRYFKQLLALLTGTAPHLGRLVVLLGLALAACHEPSPPQSSAAAAAQKITMACTTQPQSTLVHVALANRYFAAEGLEVLPLMHTYGRMALQSVLDNKADFATVAETPVMFSVLAGDKIFVIANIEASSENNAVVARKAAGIVAAGDLKGKRVGFTPGTTSDFFLDSLLTANGLTRQEIEPVPLKPEAMQAAMRSGQVDAVSTWNYPLAEISEALGEQGVVFYDRQIYTETFNIAARQDYVRQHPETVKRLLRALIRAESFVAGNPEAAQAIVSKASGVDLRLVRAVWKAFNYRIALDQTLLITLEDETRWAMKNRLTSASVIPDYRDFIHLESLRAIRPDSVRMKR